MASIYPFQVDAGLGVRGICMGLNTLSGEGFYFDPFTLYGDGVITNPNVVVLGEVGCGKSSLVKTFMARNVALLGQRVPGGRTTSAEHLGVGQDHPFVESVSVGRQVFAIDPKEEYTALADALGIPILRLRPGGTHRINPLARSRSGGETSSELLTRRTQLIVALLASIKGRRLTESENAILGWALETLSETEGERSATLRDLAQELADPSDATASRGRRTREALREEARTVWMDVDRLVNRDLAGMFDGELSLSNYWEESGRGLIVDVSAVLHDRRALSLVMLATISALQAVYAVDPDVDERSVPRRLSVIDEAWAILGDEDAARFIQESMKLSRKWGVSNMLVLHRVSDPGAQSESGSAASKIAEGLIADCEVKVIFRTHTKAVEPTVAAFGLTSAEGSALTSLPQGRALWKLAGMSAFVDHFRSEYERTFTDTDARMVV